MKVYDCFTFFNEMDLLELRLNQMAPYVDVFVLVEAPVTFRGQAKPLHYADNRARFAPFADKIRHVVVPDMPAGEEAWVRERFQRDCIRRGLHDAEPGDTVLVSDVDEIIRRPAVEAASSRAAFCYLTLDLFYFYANWRATSPNGRLWTKAYALPYAAIAALECLSQPRERDALEYLRDQALDPARAIVDHAGWHFSWTGGPQRLVAKMDAFSHGEDAMQRWNDADALAEAIANQRFFYDGEALENLNLSVGFPSFLRDNERRFQGLGLVSPNAGDGCSMHEASRLVTEKTIAELQTRLAAVQNEQSSALAQHAESREGDLAVARDLRTALDAAHASASWRVTAPARYAATLVRRAFGLMG